MPVEGIMLRRSGEDAVVEVEMEGKWYECIREPLDSNFSHIIEPGGLNDIRLRRT